ncbi:MAG: type II 3-dehydroquinate dehydratase [Pseudomonadota bacterium]
MMPSILFINGPNLNRLGQREPEQYGLTSLEQIAEDCTALAKTLGLQVEFRQSNHEGVMLDWVHDAIDQFDGLIINAGAFTHSSVALFDALKMLEKPAIELHLSNIFARESFRHHSWLAPAVDGVICGFGAYGYRLALHAIHNILAQKSEQSRELG